MCKNSHSRPVVWFEQPLYSIECHENTNQMVMIEVILFQPMSLLSFILLYFPVEISMQTCCCTENANVFSIG